MEIEEYRKKIIEKVNEIENENYLHYIYVLITEMHKECRKLDEA